MGAPGDEINDEDGTIIWDNLENRVGVDLVADKSAENLSLFLTFVGIGIIEVAESLEAAGAANGAEALNLRDYASQMWAVAEKVSKDGSINWEKLEDRVGIDLVFAEEVTMEDLFGRVK